MKTIWKFGFDIDDEVSILMPKDARILTVQPQYDQPTLWAEVDPDNERELRRIVIRGTGHTFSGNEGEYIGTFQHLDGRLVWHVYEYKEG